MSKRNNYRITPQQNADYQADIIDFGSKIRKYRVLRGLSMDDLSEMLGSDKSAVSKLENRDRIPKYDTVLKLCDALHITPAMLSPNRFLNTESENSLSQIYERLIKLPQAQRGEAIDYICDMLDGLILRNSGTKNM